MLVSKGNFVKQFYGVRNGFHSRKIRHQKKFDAIKARLLERYTVEQIIAAMEGGRGSPFHMGQSDPGIVYDDLTLICRNGAKLKFFINLKARPSQTEKDCSYCSNARRVTVNDWNAPCPKCRPQEARSFWKARGR